MCVQKSFRLKSEKERKYEREFATLCACVRVCACVYTRHVCALQQCGCVLDVLPEVCFMTVDLPTAELLDLLRGERGGESKGEDRDYSIFGKTSSECDLGNVDATLARMFFSECDLVSESLASLGLDLPRGSTATESRRADAGREITRDLLKLLENDFRSSWGPVSEG